MRLLLIANDFPNPYDPTKAVFNLNLMRALAKHNQVQVISPISWWDEFQSRRRHGNLLAPDRRAILDGVEVFYPRYYYPPRSLRSTYGWWYWQSIRRLVRGVVGQSRPDAILGYWLHPDGQAAVRAAAIAGVPSAVCVGGSDLLQLTKCPSRKRRVVGVLQDASKVITVNRHLQQTMIDFGIDPQKIHIRTSGVDTDQFSIGDRVQARRRLAIPIEGNALLWVGRMVPVKGLDVLISACDRLRLSAQFHLYLVGDGPLRKDLESQVARAGLQKLVSFVGTRPQDQLPDWYRAANVTVLPSRSEGLPNVLRESLACGTPFVASSVGGIPEIAEPPLDRLVAPDNPAALADALAVTLNNHPTQLRTRSPAGSWAESANSLVSALKSLKSTPDRCAIPSVGF